jgi:hypothetical protein
MMMDLIHFIFIFKPTPKKNIVISLSGKNVCFHFKSFFCYTIPFRFITSLLSSSHVCLDMRAKLNWIKLNFSHHVEKGVFISKIISAVAAVYLKVNLIYILRTRIDEIHFFLSLNYSWKIMRKKWNCKGGGNKNENL